MGLVIPGKFVPATLSPTFFQIGSVFSASMSAMDMAGTPPSPPEPPMNTPPPNGMVGGVFMAQWTWFVWSPAPA